jgi:hypothetical protein
MNTNPSAPGPIESAGTVAAEQTQVRDWRYWIRKLLVCNPFFLCSAALLLYGVNRLSVDPGFLSDVTHNLLFNFFALQFYEVLVVVTAVVLARRNLWYDSALLAVLENGLVLVPFMLISQATLEGEGMKLAWTLVLAGGALAFGRFAAVRRWYRQFNLPPRALALGGLILIANVALPVLFRPRMEKDVADWQGANLFIWYVVLPLIAAGANLLRRPSCYGGSNPERHWLPLFNYGLWVVGSAVHVWCVAHICNLPLEWLQLAPLTWVGAWTMWNRISDCVPNPSPRWRNATLLMTSIAPLLAFNESWLFLMLVGINLVTYSALSIGAGEQTRAMTKHLALASMALMVAGIPIEWGHWLLPTWARSHAIFLAWTFYLILLAFRSARPEAGVFGAIALAADTGWLAREAAYHFAGQAGLLFLLIHSLRWSDSKHRGATFLRYLAATLWSADAILWTYDAGLMEGVVTGGNAVALTVAWWIAWWLRDHRGPMVIPVAATVTLLAGPGNWFLGHGSAGLIAIVGSLALFSAGVVVAWTRNRWESTRAAPKEPGASL